MRTSIFHNREAVETAVSNASSMKEAIELLGLRAAGGNYRSLIAACKRYNLIVPRSTGEHKTAKARESNRKLDSDIFIENSTYSNRTLIKKRLYAMGVREECASCGIGPVWNGKPLTLTLEHKNGVWNDHRLENLEILCPNCHSQTATFCGGNK